MPDCSHIGVTEFLSDGSQGLNNSPWVEVEMYSRVESPLAAAACHPTVAFLRSSERVLENIVWDVVDYHFSVTKGSESGEIAVGIPGDWLDRMSQPLLCRLAETWLMHRLEHGYEPFGEPLPCRRIMQVPFSIAEYWYLHGRLPH